MEVSVDRGPVLPRTARKVTSSPPSTDFGSGCRDSGVRSGVLAGLRSACTRVGLPKGPVLIGVTLILYCEINYSYPMMYIKYIHSKKHVITIIK